MDKIYCPSCGKENPGTAKFCTWCGQPVQIPVEKTTRKTPLEPVQSGAGYGGFLIAAGIIAIIFGIFTVGFIIGIFAIIGGAGAIYAGVKKTGGTQKGVCPYCGSDVTVFVKDQVFKCPNCSKVSRKNSEDLETIE